jgi:hypothetical protein
MTKRAAWNRKQIDEVALVAAYAIDSTAIRRLAQEWGVSIWVLYRRLKALGVARRSNSQAHKGLQVGEKNPYWKGGKRLDTAGYVFVRRGGVEVREHRVVAERIMGRSLYEGEVVHHKNHDRSDNRPENLEVIASHSEHMKAHMTSEEARKRGRMTKRSRAALAAIGSKE